MKITIEPTEEHKNYPNPTVIISYPTDDLLCEEAVDMVLHALIGWGYSPEGVFEERNKIKDLEEEIKTRPVTGQKTKKRSK